jgi:hypothetical protein
MITEEMCRQVIRNAVEIQEQENGFFRFWGYIESVERYLRVVTLEDRETIETAHWIAITKRGGDENHL